MSDIEQRLDDASRYLSEKYAGKEISENMLVMVRQEAEAMIGVPVTVHEGGSGWQELTVVVDGVST